MLRPRKTIAPEATRISLDEIGAAVRREGESAEAAVLGVAEAMKGEAAALSEVEDHLGKLVRKS